MLFVNVVTHSVPHILVKRYKMSFLKSPQADAAPARPAIRSAESGLDKFAIIDVRRRKIAHSIRDEMLASLQPCDGKGKKMPSLLLYDEIGLKLFEAITFLDEVLVKHRRGFVSVCNIFMLTRPMQYYLTDVELEILQTWATEIAKLIKPNSMIFELGSG